MIKDSGDNLIERLVVVSRVSKTVKGGRSLSFSALVVVGNGNGMVGYGHGKAKEVPDAIKKAAGQARRQMFFVDLKDQRTLHLDVLGRSGAARVYMKSAKVGRGVIAGGCLRPFFEVLGIQDVVTKSVGTNNPYNVIKACVNGLKKQCTPDTVERRLRK